jgi:hypothetical protein
MVVAVALAAGGTLAVQGWSWTNLFLGILAGLIATPIAPVSKDLTSALAAGVKAAQAIKR